MTTQIKNLIIVNSNGCDRDNVAGVDVLNMIADLESRYENVVVQEMAIGFDSGPVGTDGIWPLSTRIAIQLVDAFSNNGHRPLLIQSQNWPPSMYSHNKLQNCPRRNCHNRHCDLPNIVFTDENTVSISAFMDPKQKPSSDGMTPKVTTVWQNAVNKNVFPNLQKVTAISTWRSDMTKDRKTGLYIDTYDMSKPLV